MRQRILRARPEPVAGTRQGVGATGWFGSVS